jgi:hypothetical protein
MDRRERAWLEERYTEVGQPIPADVGRLARDVVRTRLILFLVCCGVVLGLCLYAAVALAVALLWNAAHGR